MIRLKLDMSMPDSCYDCPFNDDGAYPLCYVDIPNQRSTYPYCKQLKYWSSYEEEHYNKFNQKPDWCPLEVSKHVRL